MTDQAERLRFRVEGMDCAGCATKIDTAVRRLPGVEDVSVSATSGALAVWHRADATIGEAIEKRVTGLGYRVTSIPDGRPVDTVEETAGVSTAAGAAKPASHEGHDHGDQAHGHGHDHGPSSGPLWKSPKAILTAATAGALLLAYVASQFFPTYSAWLFGAAMLVGLIPIARRAVAAAFAGTPFSIEMLMTIAAIGAVVIGATEEAATVVFLFLIGELLEGVAAGRARASIKALADLVPKTAMVEVVGRVQ